MTEKIATVKITLVQAGILTSPFLHIDFNGAITPNQLAILIAELESAKQEVLKHYNDASYSVEETEKGNPDDN